MKKSWEPFGSCLLNSTANPAHFHLKTLLSTSNQKYATKTGAPVSVAPAQTKKSRQNLQTAPPSISDNYKFSNLLVLLKFELVLFSLGSRTGSL